MQDAVNFTPLHIACNFGNEKVCHRTFKSVKKYRHHNILSLLKQKSFSIFILYWCLVVPFTGGEFVGVPQG